MTTDKSYPDFIMEQSSLLDDITYRTRNKKSHLK